MDTPSPSSPADWTRFQAELGGIPCITDLAAVRQKSRDFFWYSPILKAQLDRKTADIVACPRTEADVVAVAAQCAQDAQLPACRGLTSRNAYHYSDCSYGHEHSE